MRPCHRSLAIFLHFACYHFVWKRRTHFSQNGDWMGLSRNHPLKVLSAQEATSWRIDHRRSAVTVRLTKAPQWKVSFALP